MSELKVRTSFGKIVITDPAFVEPIILQLTDGQCCIRPSQEQLDYVKKISAILRKHL